MLSSSQKQRIMLKSILLDGKSLQEAALWAKLWEKKLYCLPQMLQLHKPIIFHFEVIVQPQQTFLL